MSASLSVITEWRDLCRKTMAQLITWVRKSGFLQLIVNGLFYFRLRNSLYFCVFKYAPAVKQNVWNKAENREQDWGETLKIRTVRLAYIIPTLSLSCQVMFSTKSFATFCMKKWIGMRGFTHFFSIAIIIHCQLACSVFSNLWKHGSAVSNLCSARGVNSCWERFSFLKDNEKFVFQ